MTKARDLANIISDGFTADDIPSLDTAKITTGTFADARMPSTVLNSNVDLTNLSATNLTSGTVPIARLGSSGTKDSTTFLRGDNTFAEAGGGILTAFNAEEDYASTTSSTNTSFIDVGSDIVITPTATSDKVWVNVNFQGSIGGGNGTYKIVRTIGGTDTDILTWTISPSTTRRYSKWYQDTPNTTSIITYKLQMRSDQGNVGHTIYIGESGFVVWKALATSV